MFLLMNAIHIAVSTFPQRKLIASHTLTRWVWKPMVNNSQNINLRAVFFISLLIFRLVPIPFLK